MSKPLDPPIAIPLTTLPSHVCNYLPDRSATIRGFQIDRLPGEMYHDFMDAGFRRSGKVIYQNICQTCRQCIPIRVDVARFKPGKSHRRCMRRNIDLIVTEGLPDLTQEKFDLYNRYVTQWHQSPDEPDLDSMKAFLYESPVDTLEFCYRNTAGKLLAVGTVDICKSSFSSVYFYFDPQESARGLGTFGALHELAWARHNHIPFYYLGFWVRDCAAMQYKSSFRPAQLLDESGSWRNS